MEFEDDNPFDLPPQEPPGKAHARFRQSKAWKDFREQELKKADFRCSFCNTRYSGVRKRLLNLHHLDPDQYELLESHLFLPLCHDHHEFIEGWVTRLKGKQWTPGPNFLGIYRAIRDFLPIREREKAREWARRIEQGLDRF